MGLVSGSLAGRQFRWQLSEWKGKFQTTTQKDQEEAFERAWRRLKQLADPRFRRVLAAAHYFHVACRLERSGRQPGEFVAEVLLNLSKMLEVLFPGTPSETMDAARTGLTNLRYQREIIESRYIPVIALRNGLDVGHVQLAILEAQRLAVLHRFVTDIEEHFRDLLRDVLRLAEEGLMVAPEYEESGPSSETLTIIDRIAARQDQQDKQDRVSPAT
jgi:hypothetical protein